MVGQNTAYLRISQIGANLKLEMQVANTFPFSLFLLSAFQISAFAFCRQFGFLANAKKLGGQKLAEQAEGGPVEKFLFRAFNDHLLVANLETSLLDHAAA